MSFILDALKKSEAERQRQAGPALLEMRVVPPRRGLPPWAIALAALLLVNLGVLAWLALRTAGAPATATTAATAMPAGSPPVGSQPAAMATGPTPGAAAPVAAAETAPPSWAASPPATSAAHRAPPAQEAAEEPEANPADTAIAVPAPASAVRSGKGLQNYVALSSTLPALRLDLHAWAELPAERYALINMHRVREGDTLPEGPRVQQITREGVVLDYRGTEFLLGRE